MNEIIIAVNNKNRLPNFIMAMALKCPECGANLNPNDIEDGIAICEYCGSVVAVRVPGQRVPPRAPPLGHPQIARRVPPIAPRRRPPLRLILFRLIKMGVIDGKKLKIKTKEMMRRGMRPKVAVATALREMIRSGDVKIAKIEKGLEKLAREGLIAPIDVKKITEFIARGP